MSAVDDLLLTESSDPNQWESGDDNWPNDQSPADIVQGELKQVTKNIVDQAPASPISCKRESTDDEASNGNSEQRDPISPSSSEDMGTSENNPVVEEESLSINTETTVCTSDDKKFIQGRTKDTKFMGGFNFFFEEIDRLRGQIDTEVEEANDVLRVLETNLEAATMENDTLTTKNDELSGLVAIAKAEKQSLAEKVQDMDKQISMLDEEKTTLQSSLDEAGVTNEKLEQMIENKREHITQLSNDLVKTTEAKIKLGTMIKGKEQEVIELEEAKADLESMLLDREEQVTNLEMALDVNETSLEEANTTVESLKEEVSSSKSRIETLEKNLQMAITENSTLTEAIDGLANQVETTKSEKQDLIYKVEEMIEEMTKMNQQKAMLQSSLDELKTAHGNLKLVNDENREQVTKLTGELGKLAGEKAALESMVQAQEEHIANLESSLKTSKSESKDQTLEIERLTEVNNTLTTKNDELSGLVAIAKAEKQSLAEKVQDMDKQISMLDEEKTTLQSSLDEAGVTNEKLEQMIENKREHITQLSNDLVKTTEAKIKLGTMIKGKEQEVIELEEAKADLESMLLDREEQVTNLEMALDVNETSLEEANTTVESLKEEVSSSKSRIETLEKNLQMAITENSTLTEAIDGLANQVETTKSEKQDLIYKVEEMIEEMTKMNQQKAMLQSSLDELKTAHGNLKLVNDENREQVTKLTGELGKLAGEKAALESMVQAQEEHIANLESSLKTSKSESKDQTLEIERLTEVNTDLREHVSSLQSSNQELRESLALNTAMLKETKIAAVAFRTTNADIESELQKYKQDAEMRLKKLQATLSDVQKQMEETKACNVRLVEEKLILEQSVDRLAEKVTTTETEKTISVDTMNCQLKSMSEDNVKLNAQVAILKEQLAEANANTLSLQEKNAQQCTSLQVKEEQVQKLEESLKSFQSENEQLTASLDAKNTALDDQDIIIADMNNKLKEANDLAVVQAANIETATTDNNVFTGIINDLKEEKTKLESTVDEKEEKIMTLTNDLAIMSQDKEGLESMLNGLDKELSKLEEAKAEVESTRK